jgi:hypothetical protein
MKTVKFIHKWLWNILIAVDQTFNAILFGDPDETISSRAAKHLGHRDGWHWLATFLDTIDPGHSKDAIEHDEGKDGLLP